MDSIDNKELIAAIDQFRAQFQQDQGLSMARTYALGDSVKMAYRELHDELDRIGDEIVSRREEAIEKLQVLAGQLGYVRKLPDGWERTPAIDPTQEVQRYLDREREHAENNGTPFDFPRCVTHENPQRFS